jgi:hypothetical protein
MQKLVNALKILDPSNADVYDSLLVSGGGSGKQSAKDMATAKSGLQSLGILEKIMEDNPSKVALGSLPGKIGARDYEAAAMNVMDAIARIRTGAAMNKEEESFYRNFLPTILDPEAVRIQKIEQLRSYFNNFYSGQQ